jgi:hypothetical protein
MAPKKEQKENQITENTNKAFESTKKVLLNVFGKKWMKVLKKEPKRVIKSLVKLYPNANTRKTYFSRIVRFLRDEEAGDDIIEKYVEMMNKYQAKVVAQIDAEKLTKNQDEKFLTWDEILDVRDKLEEIKDESFKNYQNYLIVCLYTMLPPLRTDYTPMKVVERTPKSKDHNYIMWTKHDPKFILNSYKTSWKYGEKVINKLPKDLVQVIREWFKTWNTKKKYFLLQKDKQSPLSKDDLIQRIRSIFKKYTDKQAGINILRHSFLSHVWDTLTHGDRKKNAYIMGHSLGTQSSYIKERGKKKKSKDLDEKTNEDDEEANLEEEDEDVQEWIKKENNYPNVPMTRAALRRFKLIKKLEDKNKDLDNEEMDAIEL